MQTPIQDPVWTYDPALEDAKACHKKGRPLLRVTGLRSGCFPGCFALGAPSLAISSFSDTV